jgi:putative ABC transport system permease protein
LKRPPLTWPNSAAKLLVWTVNSWTLSTPGWSSSSRSASGTEHDPALVQQALEEIFQSTPFRTTKQCQDLLRYVVENSLAGLDHLLRKRVIGSEVFGRKPDYDTGEDPVVRRCWPRTSGSRRDAEGTWGVCVAYSLLNQTGGQVSMLGLFEIFAQVFQAIWANKLRSFLTMFGIAWGVASLLLLVGLGEGFRSGNKRGLAELGTDVIMIFGGTIPALPEQHQGMIPYKLTLGDEAAIEAGAPHVKRVTAYINRQDLKEVSEFSSAGGPVMGVQVNFPEVRHLPIVQGRFLNYDDLAGHRRVVVLGQKNNNLLFPGRPSVGSFLTLNGYRFQVIGVAARIGRGNDDGDNQKLYVPLTTMMELFPLLGANIPQDAVSSLQYQPVKPELNETAKAEVHRIIAERHGFNPNLKDAFEEWDSIKSNRMIGVIFSAMDWFLGGVGIVTLALGAVGIVNIMLVTVSERTKEIGLRKALGATNRSIMIQFFLEGLVLTGVSGIVGIAGAAGLMLLLGGMMNGNQTGFDPPQLVPWSAALAFGSLTLCGVVAGIYPARKAAMLEPVEALRKE